MDQSFLNTVDLDGIYGTPQENLLNRVNDTLVKTRTNLSNINDTIHFFESLRQNDYNIKFINSIIKRLEGKYNVLKNSEGTLYKIKKTLQKYNNFTDYNYNHFRDFLTSVEDPISKYETSKFDLYESSYKKICKMNQSLVNKLISILDKIAEINEAYAPNALIKNYSSLKSDYKQLLKQHETNDATSDYYLKNIHTKLKENRSLERSMRTLSLLSQYGETMVELDTWINELSNLTDDLNDIVGNEYCNKEYVQNTLCKLSDILETHKLNKLVLEESIENIESIINDGNNISKASYEEGLEHNYAIKKTIKRGEKQVKNIYLDLSKQTRGFIKGYIRNNNNIDPLISNEDRKKIEDRILEHASEIDIMFKTSVEIENDEKAISNVNIHDIINDNSFQTMFSNRLNAEAWFEYSTSLFDNQNVANNQKPIQRSRTIQDIKKATLRDLRRMSINYNDDYLNPMNNVNVSTKIRQYLETHHGNFVQPILEYETTKYKTSINPGLASNHVANRSAQVDNGTTSSTSVPRLTLTDTDKNNYDLNYNGREYYKVPINKSPSKLLTNKFKRINK